YLLGEDAVGRWLRAGITSYLSLQHGLPPAILLVRTGSSFGRLRCLVTRADGFFGRLSPFSKKKPQGGPALDAYWRDIWFRALSAARRSGGDPDFNFTASHDSLSAAASLIADLVSFALDKVIRRSEANRPAALATFRSVWISGGQPHGLTVCPFLASLRYAPSGFGTRGVPPFLKHRGGTSTGLAPSGLSGVATWRHTARALALVKDAKRGRPTDIGGSATPP
ncbi:hypothetical protein OC834_006984, partial [Tilletia horrida]